jgi:hypothetical protein
MGEGFGVPPPPPFLPPGVPPPPLPPLPPFPTGGFPQIPDFGPTPPLGFPSMPLNMPPPHAAMNLPPGAIPPPPFGFPNFPPNFPPNTAPSHPQAFRGPPSHAFDPMALPTFSGPPRSQVHQSLPHRPPQPQPPAPSSSSSGSLAIDDRSSVATVSAAPELRDFKKEATSFVPRGIRQKASAKDNTGVNAAPNMGEVDVEQPQEAPRPDLLKALAAVGITGRSAAVAAPVPEEKQPPPISKVPQGANKDQQHEYNKFMADIGDLI